MNGQKEELLPFVLNTEWDIKFQKCIKDMIWRALFSPWEWEDMIFVYRPLEMQLNERSCLKPVLNQIQKVFKRYDLEGSIFSMERHGLYLQAV